MFERAHCFQKTSGGDLLRGEPVKDPCHYFLPPVAVDGGEGGQ